MTNGDLLNVREVGEALGVSPRTVLHWAKGGRLEATKLPGKTGAYVFRRPVVEAFRASRAGAAS